MSFYVLDQGVWYREVPVISENGDEGFKYESVVITDVPVDCLLREWESLVDELGRKEAKLVELKELYDGKEFDIVFRSDIDFKSLYGSTAEKVRRQHARDVLAELHDEVNELELSVAWIKQYIPLLKECIRVKRG